MSNGNLPAYPVHEIISACSVDGNSGPYDFSVVNAGLTKREQFAMAAMQGILFNDSANLINPEIQEIVSRLSVLCADALLAELERTK